MTPEILLLIMIIMIFLVLLSGFPVAFVLSGVALIFAWIGSGLDLFDITYLSAIPNRIYGIMNNPLLIAVPLFVFMGVMLEKAKIAEELLDMMGRVCHRMRAGLGISVVIVGALLAASTGIVGATVVTMGLISLPCMLRNKYCETVSTGLICASGTLGQIIPPSIVLILLGDQISNAHQTAQMEMGNLSPNPVSIADLFMGAVVPGVILISLYITWLILLSYIRPNKVPPHECEKIEGENFLHVFKVLVPPLLLLTLVLGSILAGIATATESASVGAVGAMILAATRGQLSIKNLKNVMRETTKVTSMVFLILIGATIFSLVFRGLGGDDVVHEILSDLPGGMFSALLIIMLVMFLLGFFLDFIEIIFVVVPIIAPVLLMMGADPIWLAILIAINLQTSFLTPPFGFALFYLRGVADKAIKTTQIYKGVVPFIIIQLFVLGLIATIPQIATWLPEKIYGERIKIKTESFEITPQESYEVDF